QQQQQQPQIEKIEKIDPIEKLDKSIGKVAASQGGIGTPAPSVGVLAAAESDQTLFYRQLQEEVLIDKKLGLLQSVEVMQFLQKRQARLGEKTRAAELFINQMKHS
uniref:RFXA_RFXANK_bdg domain-containing protein n=2 Tax=Macrostomum lignano TaxID=282301 RepID=A0A1I8J498_9PLAT